MPGFDRTGPMGAGPMTGGARGRCNPANAGNAPRYYGTGYGLGLRRGFRGGYGPGRGYGRGYGWGYGVPAYGVPAATPADPAAELDALKAQAAQVKSTLDAIENRINALKKTDTDRDSG